MNILVMGGTRFLGYAFADVALQEGHSVTLFHRGISGCTAHPNVPHLHDDREASLAKLVGSHWDVVADFSATKPMHVVTLAGAIAGDASKYILVSTTAVYGPGQPYGFTEEQVRIQVGDSGPAETEYQLYGRLKAQCEDAAHALFDDCVVVRPTYVIGPRDYTGRFTYWIRRALQAGPMLAPGPAYAPFQAVDVRDLAIWIVSMTESRWSGDVHIAAPFPPAHFGDVLEMIVEMAGNRSELIWLSREFLVAHDCDSSELPLWPGNNAPGVIEAADPRLAISLGFKARSITDSVNDILVDIAGGATAVPLIGISRERERYLIDLWRKKHK